MDDLDPSAQAVLTRVRDITCLLQWLRAQENALAAERDQAIKTLVSAGLSYEQVRRVSGVSRGRVGQIVAESRG
jgi:hypothetical protein